MLQIDAWHTQVISIVKETKTTYLQRQIDYMKNVIALFFLVCIFTSNLFGQTYITDVTIVDVELKDLVSEQTIVITDDLITNVESSRKLKIPENATIIDGSDKYILAGLTDAHVHFFQNGGLYTRPDAIDLRKEMPYHKELDYSIQKMDEVLRRYLQNGITNVIDVGATHNLLKKRASFEDRQDVPSIYMTGPLLTTYEPSVYENLEDDEPFSLVKTVEDGVKMVQEQLPLKPDFIKIWYITTHDGISIEVSARKNLPIIKPLNRPEES